MSDEQLSALFAYYMPPVQMPADVRQRVRGRVLAETRRLRHRLLVQRAVALAIVAVLLAAGGVEAQVWCDPCPPTVWLPIVFGEVTQ